jgi:hypothetical protein
MIVLSTTWYNKFYMLKKKFLKINAIAKQSWLNFLFFENQVIQNIFLSL